MRILNWSNVARGLTMTALVLAVVIGCESGSPNLIPDAGPPSSVSAQLPDVPLAFAPGSTAARSSFIDVSRELTSEDPTDAAFGIAGDDLSISVFADPVSPNAKIVKKMTISLSIAEGASSTPCSSGIGAGRFVLEVSDDGSIARLTPERPRLGAIVAAALRGGELALCTKVEANFTGQILIRRTTIDLAFNGAAPTGTIGGTTTVDPRGGDNTNGNKGDNTNGNTDDNSNGNTDDNSNGNTDDNSNGNTDDSSNGNTDDSSNGNTDDNSNGNTDDSSNGNTDDNSNSNTDDNSNGNTDGNTNGNGNNNGNDNSNGNSTTGICPDGGTRLAGELDTSVELEAEYRWAPNGCSRFEVKVRGYAAGIYDILVNDVVVGTISVGGNGRGEIRWRTSEGTFPSDFPMMADGDVVAVGDHAVTVGPDCSEDSCD